PADLTSRRTCSKPPATRPQMRTSPGGSQPHSQCTDGSRALILERGKLSILPAVIIGEPRPAEPQHRGRTQLLHLRGEPLGLQQPRRLLFSRDRVEDRGQRQFQCPGDGNLTADALQLHLNRDIMHAEKSTGDAVKDAKGRDSGEHGLNRGPLAPIGPVIYQGQHGDIPQMEGGWAMSEEAEAQAIQGHRLVVAVLNMPDTSTLTKASGRRRLKVTRAAPITATPGDEDPFQGIGTLFSHLSPPFVMLR